MAKSEFAFATVKTVKPLTIQLDGDPSVIPAVAYGVTVKVKQRVEVRVRKPPQPPMITRVLNAVPADLVVMDALNRYCIVTIAGDITESDPTNLSGLSLVAASDGFAVAGDAVSVDSDLYPDGTVFAISAFGSGAITKDQHDARACVLVAGDIGGGGVGGPPGGVSLNLFPKEDGSLSPALYVLGSSCSGTVISGAISVVLSAVVTATNVTDPVATLTGSVAVYIYMYPVLVSGGTP